MRSLGSKHGELGITNSSVWKKIRFMISPSIGKHVLVRLLTLKILSSILPAIALPKQLLTLQFVRIGGVFQPTESSGAGKNQNRKRSARNENISPFVNSQTGSLVPPELAIAETKIGRNESSESDNIHSDGLAHVLQSMSLLHLGIESITLPTIGTTHFEIDSEGDLHSRPISTLKTLHSGKLDEGHQNRRGTVHIPSPDMKQHNMDLKLVEQPSIENFGGPMSSDYKTSEQTESRGIDVNRFSRDYLNSLPIFLNLDALGNFNGIPHHNLLLDSIQVGDDQTNIQSIMIPALGTIRRSTNHKRLFSPKLSSVQMVTSAMQSEVGRQQFFELPPTATVSDALDLLGATGNPAPSAVGTRSLYDNNSLQISGMLNALGSLREIPSVISEPSLIRVFEPQISKNQRASMDFNIVLEYLNQRSQLLIMGAKTPLNSRSGIRPLHEYFDDLRHLRKSLSITEVPLIPIQSETPTLDMLRYAKHIDPVSNRRLFSPELFREPLLASVSELSRGLYRKVDFVTLHHLERGHQQDNGMDAAIASVETAGSSLHYPIDFTELTNDLAFSGLTLVRVSAPDQSSPASRWMGLRGRGIQSVLRGRSISTPNALASHGLLPQLTFGTHIPSSIDTDFARGSDEAMIQINRPSHLQVQAAATKFPQSVSIPIVDRANFPDSEVDFLSLSSMVSTEATVDNDTDIGSTRPHSNRTILGSSKAEATIERDDLDFQDLRSMKNTVHSIMNEQLRRYGLYS
jgi:hypothetical protein